MNNLVLRRLAGLSTDKAVMEKKKWSGDVVAKTHPAEGTFTKKAGAIVRELLKVHNGDVGKSIQALVFYCNRAGKNCENRAELDKAKEILQAKMKKEELNTARRLAGLPIIESKDEMPEDDAAEGEVEGEAESEEEDEDDLPKIVEKMVAQLLKKGMPEKDALTDLIMKVYDAGFKDGQKEAEEEEGEEEDAPDSEAEQKQ